MIRSLYSGVSGMKNHQVRMDVLGNNIANVNTYGYKARRANFQDALYQTVKSGGTSTNPAQIGLGINVGSINSIMSDGGLQTTGRNMDLAIAGDGFFKVTNSGEEYYTRDGVFYFTQTGDLVNSNGYQVRGEAWDRAQSIATSTSIPASGTPGGTTGGILQVRGVLADGSLGKQEAIDLTNSSTTALSLEQIITKINDVSNTSGVRAFENSAGELELTTVYDGYDKNYETNSALYISDGSGLELDDASSDFYISGYQEVDIQVDTVPIGTIVFNDDGIIRGTDTDGNPLKFAGGNDVARISLFRFNNQDGLLSSSGNLFEESASSGAAQLGAPASDGYGTINSHHVEMSNVNLTDEFTNMITTQRGYQANSRIITVSDTMLEELINLKR